MNTHNFTHNSVLRTPAALHTCAGPAAGTFPAPLIPSVLANTAAAGAFFPAFTARVSRTPREPVSGTYKFE